MKQIIGQYIIGIVLALMLYPVVSGVLTIPEFGWHFLTAIYLTIFIFQVAFYFLASNLTLGWSVLSFIINFIVWTVEQVAIEKAFHFTFFYQDDNYKIGVIFLGASLWVTNKIVIESLLKNRSFITERISRLEKVMKMWWN